MPSPTSRFYQDLTTNAVQVHNIALFAVDGICDVAEAAALVAGQIVPIVNIITELHARISGLYQQHTDAKMLLGLLKKFNEDYFEYPKQIIKKNKTHWEEYKEALDLLVETLRIIERELVINTVKNCCVGFWFGRVTSHKFKSCTYDLIQALSLLSECYCLGWIENDLKAAKAMLESDEYIVELERKRKLVNLTVRKLEAERSFAVKKLEDLRHSLEVSRRLVARLKNSNKLRQKEQEELTKLRAEIKAKEKDNSEAEKYRQELIQQHAELVDAAIRELFFMTYERDEKKVKMLDKLSTLAGEIKYEKDPKLKEALKEAFSETYRWDLGFDGYCYRCRDTRAIWGRCSMCMRKNDLCIAVVSENDKFSERELSKYKKYLGKK